MWIIQSNELVNIDSNNIVQYNVLRTLHRTHRIRLIDDDHIDVGQLQSLQARLHALDDVLARQATLLGLGAPVDLCRDHVAGALPAAAGDNLAQLGF